MNRNKQAVRARPTVLTSVEKAFQLLEFLATRTQAMALGEIAHACGLQKPSAVRLLRTLQSLGYVDRPAGTRDYTLGVKLATLAGADPHDRIKIRCRPILRAIHQEFNETVNLGALSGNRVIYLEYLETTQPLRMIVTPGADDPWYRTALGRAIAMSLPSTDYERLLACTVFEGRNPKGVAYSQKSLSSLIERFKKQGFSEELGEMVKGAGCVAVSLAGLGFPSAALSVAVPLHRLNRTLLQRIAKALHASTSEPSAL